MTAVDPWVPVPVRIGEVIRETANVFTWILEPEAPFGFRPGQFNMVYQLGQGEVPISISGDPADPTRLVHTIRAVGSVTRPMASLRAGDVVGVRGPYGSGWPLEAAVGRDLVLAAGGIGLAPLRPALHHALRHRGDYARVVLLYGARTPEDRLFSEELEAAAAAGVEVHCTVDRAGPEWSGPVGLVTKLMGPARLEPSRAFVMTCGPEVMMRAVVREAERLGVAGDAIAISNERNMKCAIGLCGHCQWGPDFVCREGPVYRWSHVAWRFDHREL